MDYECVNCGHWSLSRTEYYDHKRKCGAKRLRLGSNDDTSAASNLRVSQCAKINEVEPSNQEPSHDMTSEINEHWGKMANSILVQLQSE